MKTSGRAPDHRNLVITGYMGTGKSAVGKVIAGRLGRDFVDTDELIEQRTGYTIPEIFEARGEAHFRALETDICRELAAAGNLVISTGGWTLGSAQNRSTMEREGLVVCLTGTVPALVSRLGSAVGRPMLDDPEWESRFERLLAQRLPVYKSFPFQVDTTHLSVEAVADRVLALWRAFAGADDPEALPVVTADGTYSVVIGSGLLDRSGVLVDGLGPWPCAVCVSDDNVAPLYGQRFLDSLKQAASGGEKAGKTTALRVMPAGEINKTLDTVSRLYDGFLEAGLDRNGMVLALGGGVVGDVAGFAAATFMRGVRVVQLPTTLLAMVDSSVGGKTGVDLASGKNLVGAFKQPELVIIDPDVLDSLPAADLRSGMAEVIKAGVIGSPQLFEKIERDGIHEMAWMIRQAVAVKIDVVQSDPYEHGRRAVLNLGHTFGHAFELLSDFELRHGEGVGIGMVIAARLAQRLGYCSAPVVARIEAVLNKVGLPVTFSGHSPESIWNAMSSDKKKRGRRLRFVLPLDIGSADLFDDIPQEVVLEVLAADQQAE